MTAPPPPDALLAQPDLNWAAVNPPLVLIPLGSWLGGALVERAVDAALG